MQVTLDIPEQALAVLWWNTHEDGDRRLIAERLRELIVGRADQLEQQFSTMDLAPERLPALVERFKESPSYPRQCSRSATREMSTEAERPHRWCVHGLRDDRLCLTCPPWRRMWDCDAESPTVRQPSPNHE